MLLAIVVVDLAALGGIIAGFIVTTLRLRRSRLARPTAVTTGLWARMIALVAGLGFLVLSNTWLVLWVSSSDNQGRPTQAQVVGTWTGTDGAVLRVLPNGTFTARGLPPDTGSPTGTDVALRRLPVDEDGTWQITGGQGTWYLLCSLRGGPQFQLYVGSPTVPGALLSAKLHLCPRPVRRARELRIRQAARTLPAGKHINQIYKRGATGSNPVAPTSGNSLACPRQRAVDHQS